MSRWRIDFVVQELDVPPEDARGIKFGDAVEVEEVMDFFDRCRDAVRTLLGTKRRQTLDELRQQLAEEKKKAEAQEQERRRLFKESIAARPDIRVLGDGSRGGDGPPDPEWVKHVASRHDPNRYRY